MYHCTILWPWKKNNITEEFLEEKIHLVQQSYTPFMVKLTNTVASYNIKDIDFFFFINNGLLPLPLRSKS